MDKILWQQQASLGMHPAQQGFDAVYFTAIHRDDGLIIDLPFLFFHRALHIRFQLQQLNCFGMHGSVKDLVATPSFCFGAVHGGVCIAQDILRLWIFFIKQNDANTDRGGSADG